MHSRTCKISLPALLVLNPYNFTLYLPADLVENLPVIAAPAPRNPHAVIYISMGVVVVCVFILACLSLLICHRMRRERETQPLKKRVRVILTFNNLLLYISKYKSTLLC